MADAIVSITERMGTWPNQIKFAWTSDDEGAASAISPATLNGIVESVTFVPGAGDDAPSDNYDVTITDMYSVDILHGAGENRSSSATESISRSLATALGEVCNSQVTLNVSGAGANKKGAIYLNLR